MSEVVPWEIPNWFQAMTAGAQTGLQRRGQDIAATEQGIHNVMAGQAQMQQQQEAANRLALGYASLASQEQRTREMADARHQGAAQALALAGQRMQALNARHAEEMAMKDQQLQQHQQAIEALDNYRKQRLEQFDRALDEKDKADEELTTEVKDGETFMKRGGKYYHVPKPREQFSTMTETIPAEEASDEIPAEPAKPGGWFGFGAKPAVPGKPAKVGHGKITITRRVPAGDALQFGSPAGQNVFEPDAEVPNSTPPMDEGTQGVYYFDTQEDALASGKRGYVNVGGKIGYIP